MRNIIYLLAAGMGICTIISLCMVAGGIALSVIVTLPLIGAAVAWGFTTLHRPVVPIRLAAPYLVALAAWMAHAAELHFANFPAVLSAALNQDIDPLLLTAFISYIVPGGAALGGVLLVRQNPFGYLAAWAMFIVLPLAMVPIIVLAFATPQVGGHYFPGLYTAPLPILSGFWGIIATARGLRKEAPELMVHTGGKMSGAAQAAGKN